MGKKIRVAILFGGKSAEHEVSINSARNIAEALDKNKYDTTLIGIDKSGHWLPAGASQQLLGEAKSEATNTSVALIPEGGGELTGENSAESHIDVVFPVLHGPMGEDGTVQGMLRLANVPYVGAGVLGSAIGMDKDVMKRLLRDAGIPIGKFLTVRGKGEIPYGEAAKQLGSTMFIKPANMGSSVGVSKARNAQEFKKALDEAFQFDSKVLIEEFIEGREIECSVLGNDDPIASVPGEIIVHDEFYSYEAKYIDENGATLAIPAELPADIVKKVQELSVKTFKTLSCQGMARVDSFLTSEGKIYVNEINTIPGFTNISMYPKLWEASGISYSQLIDKLITLAIERFEKEQELRTTR